MDDSQIVDLYFARSETAIQETDSKYGGYCYKIAYGILANREDSEESVSDTYLSAWNCIPPRRPARLSTFLGKLTRNIIKAACFEIFALHNGIIPKRANWAGKEF